MNRFNLSTLRALPDDDERELSAQHDANILQILPLLGPLFGLCIILFAVWDFLIDPLHAPTTLAVRAIFVLIGALAYLPTPWNWPPVWRYGHFYCSHAFAIIISEFLLKDGLLYGLANITAIVFLVSVLTLRIRTFLLILCIPSLLFFTLSAIRLPALAFASSAILYLLAVGLACIVMLVIRSFRQKAFLFERKLIDVARHDSLTGACNRGYLNELAEREIALAKRHGRPLAVAMLDIDHFKRVNDTYGHNIGDSVIKMLVTICQANLRVIDHFGRIGGEEFACVLPETGESDAMICAERLRASIEAITMETPQGRLRITVSIGVVILNSSHADWSALLKDADGAMYRAKQSGRNRVVLAPASSPP